MKMGRKAKRELILISQGPDKYSWPLDTSRPHACIDGITAGLGEWYARFPNKVPVISVPAGLPPAFMWMVERVLKQLRPPVRLDTHSMGGVVFMEEVK